MKILATTFKNIKSLKGEFTIDFSDKKYIDNGIFVITGDTGAGKTTILDAIKLSLYPPSNFEMLMSKGTGECYSATDFEVDGKRYRAIVGLRRARGKAEGALQSPTCSLVNLKSGEEITKKISEFRSKVPEITKLTAEQFTSSVILSQGEFDKFLKADEKSKASILEEITSTKIYSDIGIKIYNKYTDEKNALGYLNSQIGDKKPLSAEERASLASDLDSVKASVTANENEIDALKVADKWYKDKSEWNDAKSALENDARNNELSINAFANDKVRLELSRRAARSRELKVSYDRLKEKVGTEEETLSQDKEEFREDSENLSRLIGELLAAKSEKEKCLAFAEAEHELAGKVRQLDGDIRLASSQLESIANQIRMADTAADKEKLNSLLSSSQTLSERLSTIDSEFQKYAFLPELETQYALIENSYNNSIDLGNQLNEIVGNIEKLTGQEKDAKDSLKAAEEAVKAKRDDILAADGECSGLFMNPIQNPGYALNLAKSVVELRKSIAESKGRLSRFDETIKKAHADVLLKKGIKEDKERIVRLSNDNATLSALLDELRIGQSCPLCGSLEHPHILVLPDDDERLRSKMELRNAEEELERAETAEQSLRADSIRENTKFENWKTGYNQNLETLGSLGVTEEINNDTIERLEALISGQKKVDSLKDELIALERSLSQINLNFNNVSNSLSSQREKESDTRQKYLDARKCVEQTLAHYGVATFAQLEKTLEQARELRSSKLAQEELLSKAKSDADALEISIADKEARLEKLKGEKGEAEANRNRLETERQRIYGSDNPDERDKTASDRASEASLRFATLETSNNRIEEHKALLEKKIASTEARLTNLRTEGEAAQKAFTASFVTSGFKDEDEWCKALLTSDEEERLASEDRRILDEAQMLLGRRKALEENGVRLEERKKSLCLVPEESLATVLETAVAKKSKLDQRRLELSNEIEADNRLREELSELAAQVEKQKAKVELYKSLNDIAGAADGATFRKYAQSLTFGNLVAYANRQLENMYPRYSLIQQKESPLVLSVRDSYQAGSVRSVNSLSGGERFIVSLALALGLSDMSSGSIRIDTFFLDEGFGTLSSELLDEVLEALSAISSSGKLIGLISHVEKLKESIKTAIEVTPIGVSGFSTLSGPGVSAKL